MPIEVDIIEAKKYGHLHSSFKRRIHCILKIFKLFVFLPITEFYEKNSNTKFANVSTYNTLDNIIIIILLICK